MEFGGKIGARQVRCSGCSTGGGTHRRQADGGKIAFIYSDAKHRRGCPLRCAFRYGDLALFLNSNSERTQQYGANERKHGEHRQHIEPQGKVHVSSPLLLKLDLSLAETPAAPK